MQRYMIMIRGGYEKFATMSPEETQKSIERYRAWTQTIVEKERFLDGDKLADDGVRTLNRRDGATVLDGPFAETKETIGGVIIIRGADYGEAAELCAACPIFEDGGNLEIREIDELGAEDD